MDNEKKAKIGTSWGGVADWYHEYLEKGEDTFQRKVILPNLLRLADLKKSEKVLDLACGEGFFAREFKKTGVDVVGVDVSESLIKIAKNESDVEEIKYFVSSSDDLSFLADGSIDKIFFILAAQNIEKIKETFAECKRVLRSGGKIYLVMNHPAFRIPKSSEWGFDEKNDTQYRRINAYLSESKELIEMHPGKDSSVKTVTFHRPLQLYFKIFAGAGLCVTRLEEWISHKKSQPGPRQSAEDKARKEIPMFLFLEVEKR